MSPSRDRNVPPTETNYIFISGEKTSSAEMSKSLEDHLKERGPWGRTSRLKQAVPSLSQHPFPAALAAEPDVT